MPNSLVSIGTGAFEGCLALNEIVMPNNISQVGSRAFAGCSSLISVSISNNLKTIEKSCFDGCGSLTAVSVPYGVTKIAEYAFRNCVSLTIIVLPSSVTTIGERAFTGCGALTTVTLGKGIYRIYEYAFASCKELSDVYCYADNVPLTELSVFKNSYVEYATLHVRKSLIDAYSSTYPWSTFKNIVKLDLPQYTLKYIVDGEDYKSYQLEECEGITPEPSPTKEGYSFSGWSDIPVTMPAHDVTITGTFKAIDYKVDEATYEVSGGEATIVDGENYSGDVELPSTVVINNVTYPVTTISDGAFQDNTNITSATIPESVTVIGANAFNGCRSLGEVNLGKSVTTIGSKAFANLHSPAGVRRANTRGTSGLVIKCYATSVPTTAADAFENTSIGNATLLVDDDSVNAYKTAAPWNGFGTIMGFSESTGINGVWIDNGEGAKIFSIDGKPLNNPQKGINIIRMDNGKTKKVVVK